MQRHSRGENKPPAFTKSITISDGSDGDQCRLPPAQGRQEQQDSPRNWQFLKPPYPWSGCKDALDRRKEAEVSESDKQN